MGLPPTHSPRSLNTRHPRNVQNSHQRERDHIFRRQRLALLSIVEQIFHRTLYDSYACRHNSTALFPATDLREDKLEEKHASVKKSAGHPLENPHRMKQDLSNSPNPPPLQLCRASRSTTIFTVPRYELRSGVLVGRKSKIRSDFILQTCYVESKLLEGKYAFS